MYVERLIASSSSVSCFAYGKRPPPPPLRSAFVGDAVARFARSTISRSSRSRSSCFSRFSRSLRSFSRFSIAFWSGFGAVRPGQPDAVQYGFTPGFRPSHPPHVWQMSGSSSISLTSWSWRALMSIYAAVALSTRLEVVVRGRLQGWQLDWSATAAQFFAVWPVWCGFFLSIR